MQAYLSTVARLLAMVDSEPSQNHSVATRASPEPEAKHQDWEVSSSDSDREDVESVEDAEPQSHFCHRAVQWPDEVGLY